MNEPVFCVVKEPAPEVQHPPRLPLAPWSGGTDRALTCVYLALGMAVCSAALLFVGSMADFAVRAGGIAESLRRERWTVRSAPVQDLVSTNARATTGAPAASRQPTRSPG